MVVNSFKQKKMGEFSSPWVQCIKIYTALMNPDSTFVFVMGSKAVSPRRGLL